MKFRLQFKEVFMTRKILGVLIIVGSFGLIRNGIKSLNH